MQMLEREGGNDDGESPGGGEKRRGGLGWGLQIVVESLRGIRKGVQKRKRLAGILRRKTRKKCEGGDASHTLSQKRHAASLINYSRAAGVGERESFMQAEGLSGSPETTGRE